LAFIIKIKEAGDASFLANYPT
jgi:hypothetical protein